MDAFLCILLFSIVAELNSTTHAFVNRQSSSIRNSLRRGCPRNSGKCMTLDNFKDDIDRSSSSCSELQSPSTPKSSYQYSAPSISGSSLETQQRPHRTQQIESIQGVWWTSEEKDQLVEIRSGYAIFDVMQKTYVSSTSPMPPAVAYPLGGTNDIVTLRTFKLEVPIPSENGEVACQWVPSPTSKVSVQRGGGTAIGVESPSVQMVSPTSSTSFLWERCTNPQEFWKSDRVVQGYEESLTTLLSSEGPHWSASPVDVLRACMRGIQSDDMDSVDALCRFAGPLPALAMEGGATIGREHSNNDALNSISEYFKSTGGVSTYSIVNCHYYSPDVCTLRIKISNPNNNENHKTFEFCLSRKKRKPDRTSEERESSSDNKVPAVDLFDSIMDVDLLVNGKTWAIDHINACSC